MIRVIGDVGALTLTMDSFGRKGRGEMLLELRVTKYVSRNRREEEGNNFESKSSSSFI